MTWSYKIARVSGIDIKVHATFLIIVVIGAAQFSKYGWSGYLFGTALILLLFLCVTLHELGHSVVAQKFGVTVRQIVLLPIGGVAMMQRIPANPWQELWIAVAGPAVNVVIASALAVGVGLNQAMGRMHLSELLQLSRGGPSAGLMLLWLFQANVALVLFNMIPAFPLDGGRVLRALLAMRMPYARATAAASGVGQFVAILFGTYGILSGNFLLAIVAAFIFFGAGAEAAEARARSVLAGHRVGEAYNRDAATLTETDHVSTAVDRILTSYQPDFAVMKGRDLAGVVTRADVIGAPAHGANDAPVMQVMKPQAVRVQSDATLEDVRRAMGDAGMRLAAVYEGPHYLGLVSAEDLDEAFAILQFMNLSRPAAPRDGGEIKGGEIVV